jgi:hypothetical protein
MNLKIKLLFALIIVIGFAVAEKYYTFESTQSNTDGHNFYDLTNESIANEPVEQEEITGGTCTKCGKRFTGRGYTEVSDGVWEEEKAPYQSYICSRQCGQKHTDNWHEVLDKKKEGRVYESEPCGLCGGSGVETSRSATFGDHSRTCPMCQGKGYQSY